MVNPNLPSPGEMVGDPQTAMYQTGSPQTMTGSHMPAGDPHHFHNRTSSLGEIHQEIEQEQEAQVVSH